MPPNKKPPPSAICFAAHYTLKCRQFNHRPELFFISDPMSAQYDCDSCAAYCCGYPIIEAKPADIRRLARHFGISADDAKEKFTEKENNRVRKMRQVPDAKLGAPVCMFLNRKTRGCSIYGARPQICRDYPGDRCEWNDRRLLETIASGGAKVIRLKVMPWKIDAGLLSGLYRKQTSGAGIRICQKPPGQNVHPPSLY